ncbi:GtrA family protein [Novosphingobium piscinae]|uniref:GtrA family protein n=1 Tax=Novosphingobium piscinae TaxID=1507448 RepID=A0A7X1KRK5_9SPHN|nr:GtrA family protein [Novosphingobium piscinae]MBC2670901.1 GtrA family protein [Novosphingobium piscinae]
MARLRSLGPRYLVASALCFVTNNVLLLLLARAGMHYAPAVGIAICFMIPFSYVVHSGFTYRVGTGAGSFARYAAGQVVNAPVAILIYALLCDGLGLAATVATPVVTVVMVMWNFLCSYWALARRQGAG